MSQKPFFALVAACLLTSAGACSQDTVQPAPAPPQAIYRIAGTVVDSVSEQPISRVTVAILSTPGGHTLKTALTEADGHFAFSGLRAGKYSLTASKIGYRPA